MDKGDTMIDRLKEAMAHMREASISMQDARELIADAIAERDNAAPPDPAPWLEVARGELGVKEVKGSEHNPRILEYLASTTIGKWGASRDETAWCSAFVNWCMGGGATPRQLMPQQGEPGFHEGTGSAMARSWLGWGVGLDEPREGCVAVLRRGPQPQGHVGFYLGRSGTYVLVLGGNQGDAVCEKKYRESDVLSYRWPDTTGGA